MLTELRIHGLRCFDEKQIDFHPEVTLITGDNGTGKTSLLEAVYILGSGHSFRTRDVHPLIGIPFSTCTLFGKTKAGHTLSISKHRQKATEVLINGTRAQRASDLARQLPVQIIYQTMFQIIDAGSSVRRSMLDWGMFHVKHSYLELWNQYKKTLVQRNALLKQNPSRKECILWDKSLASFGESLHELRKEYFETWYSPMQAHFARLGLTNCDVQYYKGWGSQEGNEPLFEVLQNSFEQDCYKKSTQHGAHHADLLIQHQYGKARHFFSRGQQKLILLAMKGSQSELLSYPPVYLFDDLSAELDKSRYQTVLEYVQALNGQKVITSLYGEEKAFLKDCSVEAL